MRAVEAAANIGKPEISEQPLRDAITLERGKRCVLWRYLRTIEEREAANLQSISLVASEIEFCIQLPWKNHRNVLTPAVGAEVIRSQSKPTLICAGAGRS